MKAKHIIIAAAAALSALGTVTAAQAFDGQQYARNAKVSLEQARQIALQAVPGGRIADEELEKEQGGSGLRYSFDLKVAQGEREVGVDARSGKVLENSVEGPNKD